MNTSAQYPELPSLDRFSVEELLAVAEQLPVTWVQDNETLAACCKQWENAEILALDTEFIREKTFYPIPALVQVSDGSGIWLLDPKAITEWQPFAKLLQNPKLPKLMHSLSEDIEVFMRLISVPPMNILDTQIGAGLAGFGSGLGYQKLVEATLNLSVDKDQTRSDWLQRPLSSDQLRYAAADVRYLPAIYRVLMQRLIEQKRVRWWQHDSHGHALASVSPIDPDKYFRKIGSASRLKSKQLSVLKAICAWREKTVRELDIPRGHLFKDAVCTEIAKRLPRDMTALSSIAGISPKVIRLYGNDILRLIANALVSDAGESLPRDTIPTPYEKAQLQVMKNVVQQIAERLGISEELLMRRRDYEAFLKKRNFDVLTEWRRELLVDELIEALAALDANRDQYENNQEFTQSEV